jgi:hypothetical protein
LWGGGDAREFAMTVRFLRRGSDVGARAGKRFGREPGEPRMERSRTTPPPAATASTSSLEEQDSDVHGDHLRSLRQELLEPPEFVFSREPLQVLGAGRPRAIRDDAAAWFD